MSGTDPADVGGGLAEPGTATLPRVDEPTEAVVTAPPPPEAPTGQPNVATEPLPIGAAPGVAYGTDMSPRGRGDQPMPKFSRNAENPIPYMAVAFAVGLVAIGVVRWAIERVPSGSNDGISDTWWMGIQDFVLQSHVYGHLSGLQNLGLHGELDRPRLWWAVAAMTLAVVTLVLWVRRIGDNARAESGFFGAFLVVFGLFAWWTLPLSINSHKLLDGADDLALWGSVGEARARTALALALMLGQAVFVRWTLVHKVWRAGRLPFEQIAHVLWLPQAIALTWMLGSWTWSWFSVDEHLHGHSKWMPTDAIMRAEMWTTRATGLLVLGVLIAVTVAQHLGIREDRRVMGDFGTR